MIKLKNMKTKLAVTTLALAIPGLVVAGSNVNVSYNAPEPTVVSQPTVYYTDSQKEAIEDQMQARLEQIENRINDLESDIADGPNSKKDNMALNKIDKLQQRESDIASELNALAENPNFSKARDSINKKMEQLVRDYNSIRTRFSALR